MKNAYRCNFIEIVEVVIIVALLLLLIVVA